MTRTMCELLNLFVDGKITTPKEAWALVSAETSCDGEEPEIANKIIATAKRLLPAKRASQIEELFTDPEVDI